MMKKILIWTFGAIGAALVASILSIVFLPVASQLSILAKPGCKIQEALDDKAFGLNFHDATIILHNNKIYESHSAEARDEIELIKERIALLSTEAMALERKYNADLQKCESNKVPSDDKMEEYESGWGERSCDDIDLDAGVFYQPVTQEQVYFCDYYLGFINAKELEKACAENPPILNTTRMPTGEGGGYTGATYSHIKMRERRQLTEHEEVIEKQAIAESKIQDSNNAELRVSARGALADSCRRYVE